MRISDWSSDVCSSDLYIVSNQTIDKSGALAMNRLLERGLTPQLIVSIPYAMNASLTVSTLFFSFRSPTKLLLRLSFIPRSEEHTSELQSLMRISYDVFCLKKKLTQLYNANNIT